MKQYDIEYMREVIIETFYDGTWCVDDLTDIEILHTYQSLFAFDEYQYYKEDEF